MRIGVNMLSYKFLYDNYFSPVRKQYTKRKLSDRTVHNRMTKLINTMSMQDRHYLELYDKYHSAHRVAVMTETTQKKAAHRINLALNHLITPTHIEYATMVELFDHEGTKLSIFDNLSTRTLNALRRQDILTDKDLSKWLSFNLTYLYNIPGVGKWSQLEILKYLEQTGQLKIK